MNLYACTIQFYCDFSGYTDMMLGISLLMGLELKGNFNRPFVAQNITDFWKRWHITLSEWLNEYLFVPISFYLRGWKKWGAVFAAIVTFVISGLWHGPKYTYVFWGLMHGLALAYEVATTNLRAGWRKVIPSTIYKPISILITFHFVALSILIFDAATVGKGFDMFGRIFTTFDASIIGDWLQNYKNVFYILVAGMLLHFTPVSWKSILEKNFGELNWIYRAIASVIVIFIVYQFYNTASRPFIYLQF